MEFSRSEYWSELLFPALGDLPDPGTEPTSLVSPELAGDSLPLCHLGSPHLQLIYIIAITQKRLLYNTGNSTQESVVICMTKESENE